MVSPNRIKGSAAMVLLLALAVSACHKEEQVVAHVAQNAERAQQQAAAAASERDAERASLARIPLPTKSLYINIHDPSEWQNPFLAVDAKTIDLHVVMADANPSPVGAGGLLRPAAARRQELQIRPEELTQALIALPPGAWQYGRVVAIAESPEADRRQRQAIRRNVEAAIQKLNDLGILVEEWPSR